MKYLRDEGAEFSGYAVGALFTSINTVTCSTW